VQSASLVLIKFLIRLFSILPFRLLFLFSNLLSFLLHRIFKYRLAVVRTNLRNSFPEKTRDELKEVTGKFYQHLADILLESIKGLTLPQQELQQRFTYRNPEIFDPYFQKRQSVIVFTTHYGNWEWGVLTFPFVVKHAVAGPYKPLKNRPVNHYLTRLRARGGSYPIPMGQIGRALATFRNQLCIWVFIADQTPSDVKNTQWVNFLHQDTPFLHGVEKIARQTGWPVFMSDVQRIRRGFYEVTFEEICLEPEKTSAGEITALFAGKLEAIIRREPANWLWSHRRWKRKRPSDHPQD
jgi:KDO2-lipid IV(A) lauroyltransferase